MTFCVVFVFVSGKVVSGPEWQSFFFVPAMEMLTDAMAFSKSVVCFAIKLEWLTFRLHPKKTHYIFKENRQIFPTLLHPQLLFVFCNCDIFSKRGQGAIGFVL